MKNLKIFFNRAVDRFDNRASQETAIAKDSLRICPHEDGQYKILSYVNSVEKGKNIKRMFYAVSDNKFITQMGRINSRCGRFMTWEVENGEEYPIWYSEIFKPENYGAPIQETYTRNELIEIERQVNQQLSSGRQKNKTDDK